MTVLPALIWLFLREVVYLVGSENTKEPFLGPPILASPFSVFELLAGVRRNSSASEEKEAHYEKFT